MTNTGDVNITITAISDDKAGVPAYVSGDENADGVLNLTEVWMYNATYTVPDVASVTNNVTVTAQDTVTGSSVTDDDECTTTIERNPDINIVKSCPETATVGETITYEYTVTNTGDVDLSITSIIDDKAGVPSYIGGDDGDGIFNPGEVWLYNALYTVPDTNSITNVVTVSAEDNSGNSVSDSDDCTTTIFRDPSIRVDKTCPPKATEVGQEITYQYKVTNIGDVRLNNVVLSDDKVSPIYVSGDTNNNNWLELSETWIYTATYIVSDTSSITNTVIVTAVDAVGTTVSDSDDCTVPFEIPTLSTIGLMLLSSLLGIIAIFSMKSRE